MKDIVNMVKSPYNQRWKVEYFELNTYPVLDFIRKGKNMKRLTHKDVKETLLKDQEVKREYDLLQSEYDFLVQMYKARMKRNVTQKQLSELSGIDQSNISKIETGEYSPSLKTMKKIADALNMDLKIELVLRD